METHAVQVQEEGVPDLSEAPAVPGSPKGNSAAHHPDGAGADGSAPGFDG